MCKSGECYKGDQISIFMYIRIMSSVLQRLVSIVRRQSWKLERRSGEYEL